MKQAKLPEPIEPVGSLYDYYEKLEKMGYRRVGDGYFSSVFVKGNQTIKVAVNDSAYDAFLSYALAYQNNPLMPKIYAVARYKNVQHWSDMGHKRYGVAVTVVTMERLKHGPQRDARKRSSYFTEAGFAYSNQGNKAFLPSSTKEERQASRILGTLFKSHREDLHSKNIMMRGKQPVIIDPVAPNFRGGFSF